MFEIWSDLLLLFSSALVAATLLPVQSELVLITLQQSGQHSQLTLLLVATLGNVLGAIINWFLGRYLIHFKDRKWFPIRDKGLTKATRTYQKFGIWTLLLAWMPFIGDPLTFVAGIFKVNITLFIILVTVGKAGRYMIVLSLF